MADPKAAFQEALKEYNFGERCHKLANLGKQLKGSSNLEATLDSLVSTAADDKSAPLNAFEEKARLIVAKAAGCLGYAKKLLDHPSKTVCFSAARDGLLQPNDARAVFLSGDSSRKLKKFLLKCESLEADKEVLEHAWQLFGAKDKEQFWPLLTRANDENLLVEYLQDEGRMHDWVSEEANTEKISGFPQLARRFPGFMVRMVREGVLKWRWYWTKEILEKDPLTVLHTTIVEGHEQGSGPKTGYVPGSKNQSFYDTVVNWGWRKQPAMMLDICSALMGGEGSDTAGTYRSKGKGKGMVLMKGSGKGKDSIGKVQRLAGVLMDSTSTRNSITMNKKIALLMQIWSVVPESLKVGDSALVFAELMPSFAEEDYRGKEIENLIAAFWRILGEVGRTERQLLLVGKEGPPPEKKFTECTTFLKKLSERLPPPLAVSQFFKILEEFDAGHEAFKFMQSNICQSSNGRHDELMQSVFKRYLQKENETAMKAVELYMVLLKDARSRDVIQASLDLLMEYLDGHCELGLFQSVVQRMGTLEKESQAKEKQHVTPDYKLPLPTGWLDLVKLPKKPQPHTDFLLLVLHTGTAENNLLGAMVAKYGPIFFWEALDHVLSAARDKLMKPKAASPSLQVLRDIDVKVIEDAANKVSEQKDRPSSSVRSKKSAPRVGNSILGADGSVWGTVVADEGSCWKLDGGRIAKKVTEGDKWKWADGYSSSKNEEGACKYFANSADMKKKANVKDVGQRLSGYSELMSVASKEKDASTAFEDLLPFLVSRFNAEQEQGRTHILNDLFVNKLLPEKLWEEKLEHLRSFWKLSSKAREKDLYASIWNKPGRQLVQTALENWGKVEEGKEPPPDGPTEACLFGLEVAPDLNLPEILVCCHSKIKTLASLESTVRWVLENTVPLSGDSSSPLEDFWSALQTMGSIKFCGDDRGAVTSWKTLKDSVKVYKEKSSKSEVLATKTASSVQRGVQQGTWVELKDEPGFMLIISERDGLPTMEQDKGNTAEKGIWETYPFIGECWQKLLAQGVKQKGVDFVFTGILELLATRQMNYVSGKVLSRWWAPIECAEYKSAVANILANIESGEIPPKEGSAMLTRRIIALKDIEIMSTKDWKVQATKRRGRIEDKMAIERSDSCGLSELDFRNFPAQGWVEHQQWDVQKHQRFIPLPWQSYRCRDSVAELELKCFAKLLTAGGIYKRDVLWRLAEVAAVVSGPQLLQIVEDAIAGLDPKFEGMARSISRQYPYLNTALTKGGDANRSCDVLTPLLELCLLDDSTRDASVAKIMQRSDFEYFLFFGSSFARHLTGVRQEWLQRCLAKLKSPSESDAPLFYHYTNRGPVLLQLAHYGKAEPGWRDALSTKKGAIQMYLWHPETQEAFLSKAITSTETEDLMLLPCCSFASGVAKVSDLLALYPKEQSTTTTSGDKWGFEVIQAAGAYNDIVAEVQRRFAELPEPSFCDKVDDQEVETLLTALGRSDNAGAAMQVLGPHAGRVKQAKEAVTKMISQLSPPQARIMIRKVMLPKKAGVGLQTAGLKKIVDLRIPEPLELYKYVWRKGACQRDVAANILSKVATSPEFPPDSVREFFDFFDQADRQDDQAYVADAVLTELIEHSEWVLPFLPKVISKLSLLPGSTMKAVQALQQCKSNVTDVVVALTEVVKFARLATRAEPKNNKEGTDGRVLADLSSFMSFTSMRELGSKVADKQLDECDKSHLMAFVEELMRRWQDELAAKDTGGAKSMLTCNLSVWVKLLQPGNKDSWAAIVNSMETRLMRDGTEASLGVMCAALTQHAPSMSLAPDDWDALLEVLRQFFVRLLDGPFAVSQEAAQKKCPSDSEFNKVNDQRAALRKELLLKQWTSLLSHGCSEQESDQLFQRCPEMSKVELAVNLVTSWHQQAVEEKQSTGQTSAFQQEKPEAGWGHAGGTPVSQIKPGAHVSGTITNSSNTFGVYVNFGCEKDGKLNVPTSDWKKYRVGESLANLIVNKVNVEKKYVDLLIVGSRGQTVGVEAAKGVAKRALNWISSSQLLRENNMDTLKTQWAKLVVEGAPEDFDASLELLGTPLPVKECVSVAEKLLDLKPDVALSRHVLQWLSKKSPAEAVRLWPRLLEQTKKDGKIVVLPEDMKSLLELCADHNLELPKIPQVLAKALSSNILEMLCKSDLPEARLASIHAFREQHRSGKPPKELKALCVDSCNIVQAAGRDLWVALGGKDEAWQKKKEVEANEDEDEEDEA